MTNRELLEQALALHRRGDLDSAREHYLSVLSTNPGQCDALNLLGVLESQAGQHAIAAEYLQRAVSLADEPAYRNNLGLVYKRLDDRQAAERCFREALQRKPDFLDCGLNLATLLFKIKVRDAHRKVRTAIARINAFLQENLTGAGVVQIFGQEKKQYRRFTEINRDHLNAILRSVLYHSIFFPLLGLISACAIALIIWYGGHQVLAGTLTLGTLVAFIQYSERFFRPISDLSEKYTILQSAMASSERIFKLLDTKESIVSPRNPKAVAVQRGKIEFRNVHFSYTPGEPVLHDISFKVDPGERIAVVGATGAGKSTIIALLSRFYDVEQGEILIDGEEIRSFDLQGLRSSVGIVLQDVFLFSGSIYNNIRLGNDGISKAQAEEAADTVHASHFIRKLRNQFAAEIGERGSSLSVGQKQLLAFARALAYDPKILVLDEATSSIDTETELLIQDALKKLMAGRTSIIIAHRLSTVQDADRILVLHRGRIREMGTHQELLRLKGIYWRLYQLQYKDQRMTKDEGRIGYRQR